MFESFIHSFIYCLSRSALESMCDHCCFPCCFAWRLPVRSVFLIVAFALRIKLYLLLSLRIVPLLIGPQLHPAHLYFGTWRCTWNCYFLSPCCKLRRIEVRRVCTLFCFRVESFLTSWSIVCVCSWWFDVSIRLIDQVSVFDFGEGVLFF